MKSIEKYLQETSLHEPTCSASETIETHVEEGKNLYVFHSLIEYGLIFNDLVSSLSSEKIEESIDHHICCSKDMGVKNHTRKTISIFLRSFLFIFSFFKDLFFQSWD